MTPKLSCYFGCQIGFGLARGGRSGVSPRAQRGGERNAVRRALAEANRPLDFPQSGFNLAFERKGIERPMFLLQGGALGGLEQTALQKPLVGSFGLVVPLDLARADAAFFHQLDRGAEVIVIKRLWPRGRAR
jgi:hypothetical protein